MRMIRHALAILFTVTLACILVTGSAGASEDSPAGRYDALECRKDGEEYKCGGEYLLLNEDGSGEISFNNIVLSLKWEADGTAISFEDEDEEEASGTLEDGVIRATYYGYDYVYRKNDTSLGGTFDGEGSAVSADDVTAQTVDTDKEQAQEVSQEDLPTAVPQDAEAEGPAVYVVTSRENAATASGMPDEETNWSHDYIALNEDGTGVFLFNLAAFSIQWKTEGSDFSFTDHKGYSFTGTIGSGTITGTYGRYRYVFEKRNTTLPVYTLSPDDWGEGLSPVTDQADVLSGEEESELIQRAGELSDTYDVGVYLVFEERLGDYTWTGNVSTLSEELSAGYSLGIGPTEKKKKHEKNEVWKDAILLNIAVNERRYDLCATGDYANWAFPVYGREKIRDAFLDDLRENNWAGAAYDYLDSTEEVLKVAAKGKQISFRNDTTGRMISILVPAVLALIFGYGIAAAMRSSMQNTQKAKNAAEYVAGDKVDFTGKEDRYIRTLVSSTYSPRERSSPGGGGGSFSSSSGGSHTSGSF